MLDIFDAEGASFIFHHFSGTWGDGSSGRVTMPAWSYRRVGYDERFLPRQFDEVDAILSGLAKYPGLTLYHYETAEMVLDTDNIGAFLRGAKLVPRTQMLPMPVRRAAANPKPENYVIDSPAVSTMQSINEAMCFLKNLDQPAERERWQQRLKQDTERIVAMTDHRSLFELTFGSGAWDRLDGLEKGADIIVTASDHACRFAMAEAQASGARFAVLHLAQLPAVASDLPNVMTFSSAIGNEIFSEIVLYQCVKSESLIRNFGSVTWNC
ncbi:hypothetical protein [Paracoccus aestuariivivens]|uniref:Uncharacterized protein n=1 Tax=Paracoccus aestuariivivens TaxID=1820333 RepID=A0A6L6J9Y8_9RHOB|nr:hypothetical protein [Paracoccus aestuariivivens]MTH78356.1 hypothetical protein [Paracoccus aestuariivivens]